MLHSWRAASALAGLALLAQLWVTPAGAQASSYPARKITFVVGFAQIGRASCRERV